MPIFVNSTPHEQRDDGAPASVRGLLGQAPDTGTQNEIAIPTSGAAASYYRESLAASAAGYRAPTSASGGPASSSQHPQTYNPSVPLALQPYHRSQPPTVYSEGTGLSFEQHTPDSSDSEGEVQESSPSYRRAISWL